MSKGIRILDRKDRKCISLSVLLESFESKRDLTWKLLGIDVTPLPGKGISLLSLKKHINYPKEGMFLSFASLKIIASYFFQEIEILIIASAHKNHLHRYIKDQEMYETCDLVIEMIDGGFWEVFSKDHDLIDRLEKKFKETERLEVDFLDQQTQ